MAQSPSESLLNSLEYEELLTLFNDFEGDSLAQEKIARTYLDRAKVDGDTVKVARGYDRLARIFHPQKNLLYADSLIAYTKDWEHITYPGLGYILRSIANEKKGNLRGQYADLKRAYNESQKVNNLLNVAFSLLKLSSVRLNWGDPKGGLEFQRRYHDIILSSKYKNNLLKTTRSELHDKLEHLLLKDKIVSHSNLISAYIINSKPLSAKSSLDSLKFYLSKYNGWSKKKFIEIEVDSEIEVSFFLRKYNEVIRISDSIIDNKENIDDSDLKFYYLFKGISNLKKRNYIEGRKLLEKSDSINKAIPFTSIFYTKLIYKSLIDAYQVNRDYKNQIKYLDKLLYLDSISMVNYQFIEPEIIKTFDTPVLLQEKEAAILQLQQEKDFRQMIQILCRRRPLPCHYYYSYYYRYLPLRFRHRHQAHPCCVDDRLKEVNNTSYVLKPANYEHA